MRTESKNFVCLLSIDFFLAETDYELCKINFSYIHHLCKYSVIYDLGILPFPDNICWVEAKLECD